VENLEGLEKETFEHHEKSDAAGQKDSLSPSHPIWLPSIILVRTFFVDQILSTFLPSDELLLAKNTLFANRDHSLNWVA